MNNITTFLIWVVGILMTLTIIGFGIYWYNQSLVIGESVNRQQVEQSQFIIDGEYAAYDNQLVSGSQILTGYRRYSMQSPFYIYVQSGSNSFAAEPSKSTGQCSNFDYSTGKINSGTSSCSVDDVQMQDISSSYYIPPQSRYKSTIVRDDNRRITAIYFKAQ